MKLHYYYYKMRYREFVRSQDEPSYESLSITRGLFGRYGKKLILFPRVQERFYAGYGGGTTNYVKIADYSSKRKFQEQDFWY